MWLLKLHFSISILCLITFMGFGIVCQNTLKENRWINNEKNKGISCLLAFFVPIINIILVIVMFMMIYVKKSEFDKICEETKKNSEVSEND